jgi:nicotinamidase/pyrazinamidase
MKTVFFDIDTQIDFLFPAGALYVPEAERILPVITQLNQHAGTLVSTMCAHAEDDAEFKDWPPHCIVDTMGQLKPAVTLRERRVVIPNRPVDLAIDAAEQIILEKRQLNLFTNPNLPRLLELLAADEYVVYGVVTEYCVKNAAFGLLDTGKPVTLVVDAIQSLSEAEGARIVQEFAARGGKLATSSKLLPQR